MKNEMKLITTEHEITYPPDNTKFKITFEQGDNKCSDCLCYDCANGCYPLVCTPICKRKGKVTHCNDFDDDDDWY